MQDYVSPEFEVAQAAINIAAAGLPPDDLACSEGSRLRPQFERYLGVLRFERFAPAEQLLVAVRQALEALGWPIPEPEPDEVRAIHEIIEVPPAASAGNAGFADDCERLQVAQSSRRAGCLLRLRLRLRLKVWRVYPARSAGVAVAMVGQAGIEGREELVWTGMTRDWRWRAAYSR